MPFGRGDTVLVFTDGLIARRTEDSDEGRARLSAAACALAGADLAQGLEDTVAAAADPTHDDDLAAIAPRRHPAS